MTVTSGFFDSVNNDRLYGADFFSKFFSHFIPDGVGAQGGGLAVTASGTSMVTTVADGSAFIQGFYCHNDAPLLLTHATADPTYDRIDRIVARLDKTIDGREIKLQIKQGTPAASPVESPLQSDTYIVEIPIASVRIIAAQSTIAQSQVADERGTLLDPKEYWTQISTIMSQLATKVNTSVFLDTGWIKMSFSYGFYSSWNDDNIFARYIETPNESKLLIDSQVNLQNDFGLIEDQTAAVLPASVMSHYNGRLNRKVLVGWGGTGKLVNAVITGDGIRFETANDGNPNTVPPFQMEVYM